MTISYNDKRLEVERFYKTAKPFHVLATIDGIDKLLLIDDVFIEVEHVKCIKKVEHNANDEYFTALAECEYGEIKIVFDKFNDYYVLECTYMHHCGIEFNVFLDEPSTIDKIKAYDRL